MIREVKFESQDRRIKQILQSATSTVSTLTRLARRLSLSASRMQNGLMS